MLRPAIPRHLVTKPRIRPLSTRIYDPIRQPNDLHTLTLLCAANNRTLVTFWGASWCRNCSEVLPVVRGVLGGGGLGEGEVGFAEVCVDSVMIGGLPVVYRISSLPTLLAFSRQEARFETVVTRMEEMRDEEFLRGWVENEVRRGGRKGAG
ncbi:hypothetical protein BDW02DRAFT_532860, partial [Decorospora gaudefroyi]